MAETPRISVIIPVCNEQDTVAELCGSLGRVIGEGYEVIFVDDGSSDDTWARLRALHRPGSVKIVRFRKNFGKTAALMAGFAASRGEIVFTMDGDLQDDPNDIPRFLAKLEDGNDLVVGWKRRRHDPLTKVLASKVFNLVVRQVTGIALHDMNCGFKGFRGEVARSLALYGEMHRFIPVFVDADGHRVTEIEVVHHPRKYGKSKYGFSRLFRGSFDLVTVVLLTRFRDRPSHAFGFTGLACLVLAVAVKGARLWLLPAGPTDTAVWGTAASCLDSFAILLGAAAIILPGLGWLGELVLSATKEGRRSAGYSIEEQLD